MGLALFAFIAFFLLIGTGGLLMFYRATMTQRLTDAISSADPRWGSWRSLLEFNRARDSVKAAYSTFRQDPAQESAGNLTAQKKSDPRRRLPHYDAHAHSLRSQGAGAASPVRTHIRYRCQRIPERVLCLYAGFGDRLPRSGLLVEPPYFRPAVEYSPGPSGIPGFDGGLYRGGGQSGSGPFAKRRGTAVEPARNRR